MKYYPEYKLGNQWYRWLSRGQEVGFETEQEALEYLVGVCGETRIARGE